MQQQNIFENHCFQQCLKSCFQKSLPGSFRPVRQLQWEEEDTRPSWCFEDRDIDWEYKARRLAFKHFCYTLSAISGKTTPRLFHVSFIIHVTAPQVAFISPLVMFTFLWRLLLSSNVCFSGGYFYLVKCVFTHQTPASFPRCWPLQSNLNKQKYL